MAGTWGDTTTTWGSTSTTWTGTVVGLLRNWAWRFGRVQARWRFGRTEGP